MWDDSGEEDDRKRYKEAKKAAKSAVAAAKDRVWADAEARVLTERHTLRPY